MKIAMLAPRATVQGPLPKHTPLLVDALRDLGCEVELLPWGRRSEDERLPGKILGRAGDVLDARRKIVAGGFSVVVVKTAHDWLTLTRDRALLHVLPRETLVVLQFHGSQSSRLVAPGSWAFKRSTAALISRADGILVLSNEERSEWQRFSPRAHISVVRNPRPPLPEAVDPESRATDGLSTVVCVSRLMRSKGVFELVSALPLIQQTTPCRLVLAGDGPERTHLAELISDLGLEGSVELRGYVEGPELTGLYREADVFALPTTHNEGFPTVLLEAMAAGLPIVTTRSRGQADHLVEGEHALFVPPRDHRALAGSVVELLLDPDVRRRMGQANREKVREFDAGPVATEYLAALQAFHRR
jgi:glycosyltransferase involved in cell wall biosynthesis